MIGERDKERFMSKIRVDSETGCWVWTAARRNKQQQYGAFWLNGHQRLAHRISYEIHNGEIPEGKVLDHLCRNVGCVNPDHLEAVTHRANTLRGVGITAENAVKTHCKHGHKFDVTNTYITPKGRRHCRECHVIAQRRYKAKRQGARNYRGN